MSSRPMAPADFGAFHIRVEPRSTRRSHQTGNGVITWAVPCLAFVIVTGVLWWLLSKERFPEPAPQPTVAGLVVAPQTRFNSSPESFTTNSPQRPEPAQSSSFASDLPTDFLLVAKTKSGNADRGRRLDQDEVLNPFGMDRPSVTRNSIDPLVFDQLKRLGIPAAGPCTDEAFLRRVHIDVLGTLPTAEEARTFLDDTDPDKRRHLIDSALQRDEFADYVTMKWCDWLRVKAEFPINLWPHAAQGYHKWIHDSIRQGRPLDEFAFELLTASGSNFRKPPVNFYRALQSKEPEAIAQAVALTFLCQRTDQWPADKLKDLSVFFDCVGYKATGEWKEEIVHFDLSRQAEAYAGQPLAVTLPDGTTTEIPVGTDPRRVFADWLTDRSNAMLARGVVNRIWGDLFGRGIVEPVDDVGSHNPPVNAALLDHLAEELIAANFDLRHVYRLILNSGAYGQSCIPGSDDADAEKQFAFYPTRRHDAEVLIDAICQITGTTETYTSIIPEPFTFLPDDQRAISLPDGSITSAFLEMFGRPTRDTGMVSERNNVLTAGQTLHLMNSNHIRDKLKRGSGIRQLTGGKRSPEEKAERLYLAILSRRPTEAELPRATNLSRSTWGLRDLAWALINSDEFLFRH